MGYLRRVEEPVGTTTNMISLVASDDCGEPLFTDTRVSHHYGPARFFARASWRAIFHG
jgi:hypothetical protein